MSNEKKVSPIISAVGELMKATVKTVSSAPRDYSTFPMVPLALKEFGRVILEEVKPKEMVTASGIVIASPAGQAGQKRTYPLGRIIAVTPSLQNDLAPGDIVSFNDLGGNWQRLKWGDAHVECGVIGSMDIIAKYVGSDLGGIDTSLPQPGESHKKNEFGEEASVTHKNSIE